MRTELKGAVERGDFPSAYKLMLKHQQDTGKLDKDVFSLVLQSLISTSPSWLGGDDHFTASFSRDQDRDPTTTRVFACSDLHIDQGRENLAWIKSIHPTAFQNDVLIVAGDLADSFLSIKVGFEILRPKFRRVFFTPGNHDLWLSPSGTNPESRIFPDSICKLLSLLDLAQVLDIDMRPAEVARGLYVAPLFSWYDEHFDESFEEGQGPPSRWRFDKFAKFPVKDDQISLLMLQLNNWLTKSGRPLKQDPEGDVVITASHFLPRRELPSSPFVDELRRAVGSCLIEEHIVAVDSDAHVFGHSHINGCYKLTRASSSQSLSSSAGEHMEEGEAVASCLSRLSITSDGGSSLDSVKSLALSGSGVGTAMPRMYVQFAVDGHTPLSPGGHAVLCCIWEGGKLCHKLIAE